MKTKLIASLTIFLFIFLLVSGCTEENNDDKADPEDRFREYIHLIDEGELDDALELTDFKFSDNESAENEMKEELMEIEEISINSLDIKYENDLNQTQKETIDQFIPNIEDALDIEIDDYAIIRGNFTVKETWDSQNYYNEESYFCIYVDNNWYTCLHAEYS